MQSMPYRDLQNSTPSTLYKRLTSEGALVVTMNNKPFAVMFNLDEENAQDILVLVSRLRAQMAAASIQNQAREDGIDKMTLKEITAIIKKARVDRKRDKQAHLA